MTDIVDWLRNEAEFGYGMVRCKEAADEIERLREANDKMVRALNAISCQDADCKDDGVVWCAQRARATLEEKK